MRKTHATVQVALALLEQPQARHWGYDLSKSTGVRSGVLYPVLHRMLEEGWLSDGWEEAPPARKLKGPPRRYYEVTERGLIELGALLDQARGDARFQTMRPGLAW